MSVKNPAIGEIACPIPGCKQKAAVCQFKTTHQRDTGRRLAGKLYVKCARHGRIGFDAADDMQEWILGSAKMYNPEKRAELTAAQAQKLEAESMLSVPDGDDIDDDAEPAAAAEPQKRGGFGFFP